MVVNDGFAKIEIFSAMKDERVQTTEFISLAKKSLTWNAGNRRALYDKLHFIFSILLFYAGRIKALLLPRDSDWCGNWCGHLRPPQ